MNKKFLSVLLSFVLLLVSSGTLLAVDNANAAAPELRRSFDPVLNDRWIGNGISYAPYRDGESPETGSLTSKENILEDLLLVQKRWNLIRQYGADEQSRRVLEVIKENKLPIRVMQGAWLSGHKKQEINDEQVENLIKLANDFPEIIVAVNVGNEIFVDWSWHKMEDYDLVVGYLRKVRANVSQPVTVNDDYNFWNKPHAKKIVSEIDFIGMHAYAFWNNITLKESMNWTKATYKSIQDIYPDLLITITETGWPTSRVYDGSYEGGLIGKAGEKEQATFFKEYNEWIDQEKIISLYFEAFDEKWKGGFDGENPMDKAEKHWGVYFSDRTPKAAIKTDP